MGKKGQEANKRRHRFLLDYFFKDEKGHAVKKFDDWVLVKQLGATGEWLVAIYERQSYEKAQGYFAEYKS